MRNAIQACSDLALAAVWSHMRLAGAYFLGRALRAQGYDVRMIPAQFVKLLKSNKNDSSIIGLQRLTRL
jgi:transposase